MALHSEIKATGQLSIIKTNEAGIITDKVFVPNLVVTVGKEFIASRIASNTDSVMTYMACGSSSAAPDIGDLALQNELGRTALTTTTVTNNTVTYTATFAAGNATGAIQEAGLFNDATAGSMLARTTFNVINKDIADLITITWVITVS